MGPGTKCGLCLSAWQPLIPQLLPRIIETFANAAELPAAPGLPPMCEPPALLVPPAGSEPAVPRTNPALRGKPSSLALTPELVPEHATNPSSGKSNTNLANEI